jgi:catechol 2,3-dioxygenase-like lactoylglutathione lyase family enzyme
MSDAPKLNTLDHLVLTVRDIKATCTFYETILGMRPVAFTVADGSTRHALAFGMQKINLHEAGAEFDPKAAQPTPGSADLCFLSETPLAQWQQHLVQQGVDIEDGPVPRSSAQGPILSIYLRDPDGNLIEIANASP